MSDATRAADANDLLRDFRGSGLLWPLLLTVAVHAVVILATSLPWLQTTLGGGQADLTEEQRLDAAVKEATASLQAIAKEHGIRPQDLGNRFNAGSKPTAAKTEGTAQPFAPAQRVSPTQPVAPAQTVGPAAGGTPASELDPAGQAPAARAPAAEPQTAPPPLPPGPAIPEVTDDVDLFK